MIDGVNLNRLIGQALELDKKEKKSQRGGETPREEAMVNLSSAAQEARRIDSEETAQKLERIKREIAQGTYRVDAEKIMEGLKKFI